MVVAGNTLLLFLSDTAELFLRKKAKTDLCSTQTELKCSHQEGRSLPFKSCWVLTEPRSPPGPVQGTWESTEHKTDMKPVFIYPTV